MNNKRGQTVSTIIKLGVGILLLGIMGYFIITVGNTAQGAIKAIDPGKESLRASSCGNALNDFDFCRFSDVGEKKGEAFINCEYTGANFRNSFINTNNIKCESPKTFNGKCAELQDKPSFKGALLNNQICRPVTILNYEDLAQSEVTLLNQIISSAKIEGIGLGNAESELLVAENYLNPSQGGTPDYRASYETSKRSVENILSNSLSRPNSKSCSQLKGEWLISCGSGVLITTNDGLDVIESQINLYGDPSTGGNLKMCCSIGSPPIVTPPTTTTTP